MRDFFYKKNDILIVLIILIVAGFLIYNRVGAIMDYPSKAAEKNAKTQTTQHTEELQTDITQQ